MMALPAGAVTFTGFAAGAAAFAGAFFATGFFAGALAGAFLATGFFTGAFAVVVVRALVAIVSSPIISALMKLLSAAGR